jgi:hypothetical protein
MAGGQHGTVRPDVPETGGVHEAGTDHDPFGIRILYPTRPGGMMWVADWSSPRRFTWARDPADPWFDARHGSGSYRAGGGELRVSGAHPRMHVHEPSARRQWRDVEITMYFQRREDRGVPYAGMVAVARTNHGVTGDLDQNPCDSRGIAARLRYDGFADFEKETDHPLSQAVGGKRVWRDGMPKGTWIGFKYVVRDLAGGAVQMELWLDLTDGEDGGHWRLVNTYLDDGTGLGTAPCAAGVDPALPLRGDAPRPGSESGRPNVSVYFRSDLVAADGLVYKWGSVREIAP